MTPTGRALSVRVHKRRAKTRTVPTPPTVAQGKRKPGQVVLHPSSPNAPNLLRTVRRLPPGDPTNRRRNPEAAVRFHPGTARRPGSSAVGQRRRRRRPIRSAHARLAASSTHLDPRHGLRTPSGRDIAMQQGGRRDEEPVRKTGRTPEERNDPPTGQVRPHHHLGFILPPHYRRQPTPGGR